MSLKDRKSLAIGLLVALLALGCGEESSPVGETEAPQPDTIPSASADGSETEESEETEEADPTRYAAARTDALEMAAHPYRVVDKLAFPFADENGACIGFNLDEIASDSKEDDDCGWEDQVSPDGVPGVDTAWHS